MIDGTPHEIIGVLPSSFKFLRHRSLRCCCRCGSTARTSWVVFDFQAVARLKPGVTLAAGQCRCGADDPAAVEWVPGFKEWQLRPNVRPLART